MSYSEQVRLQIRLFTEWNLTTLAWFAVGFLLVADIMTTIIGLEAGLQESNQVAVAFIDAFGYRGMAVLKASVLLVALYCDSIVHERVPLLVPACLSIVWMVAFSINLYALSMVA